jgi:hypothetical protein
MSAANCVSVVLLGAEVAWRSADVQVNGGEKASAVQEAAVISPMSAKLVGRRKSI